jgi:hypothetical protein
MTDAQKPRDQQGTNVEMTETSWAYAYAKRSRHKLLSCPPGILILLKRAARDPDFKADLLQQRAGVAIDAEVELLPDEESWLNTMPAPELEALILAAAGRSRWAVIAAVTAVLLLLVAGVLAWTITHSGHNDAQFTVTPFPASEPRSHPMRPVPAAESSAAVSAATASPATTESATTAATAAAPVAAMTATSAAPAATAAAPLPVVAATASSAGAAIPSATAVASPASAQVVAVPSPPTPPPVTAIVSPNPAAVATPGAPTPAAALAPAVFFIPDLLYSTVGPVDLVATSDSIFVGQLTGAAWNPARAGDAWTGDLSFTCQTPLRGAVAGQNVRAPAFALGDSSDPAAPTAFWHLVNLKASTEWLVFVGGGEIHGLAPLPAAESPLVTQVKRALQITALDDAKRWPHLATELNRIGLKNDLLSAFVIEQTVRLVTAKPEAADVLSRVALNRANALEPRRAAFWALGWLAKVQPGNDEARRAQVRAQTLLVDDAVSLVNPDPTVRDAYVDALGASLISVGTFERPTVDTAALQSSQAALLKALRTMAAAYDDQARKLGLELSAATARPASNVPAATMTLSQTNLVAAVRQARRRQEICLRLVEAVGGEATHAPVETPASWGNVPAPPPYGYYGPVWPYGYGYGYPGVIRPGGRPEHHGRPPTSAWPPSSAWPPHSGLPPHH